MVNPQFEKGQIPERVTFVLSSDGFVHMLSEEEIFQYFQPDQVRNKEQLTAICKEATELVMERGERDNITVAALGPQKTDILLKTSINKGRK